MFADDTACVASNSNLTNLITFVNAELKKIARWFRANRMVVNVDKTKFIIFHTKGKKIDRNDDNEPGENIPSLIHPIERFHSNHPNPKCRSYKILGIFIDENLTFDLHTNHITAKLNRSLYCMNKVKNFLPQPAMKSLYYALIHSHLSYCPIIASCASNTNTKKILTSQKKAIRIISSKPSHAHTSPLFKNLNILPFNLMTKYAKLNFTHSVVYNYCPASFTNTWTTNLTQNLTQNPNYDRDLRNNNQIFVPHPRIELFKKSPLYSIPTVWNTLDDLCFQPNKSLFRKGLKEKLLNEIEN
jgi:hypothetical protein